MEDILQKQIKLQILAFWMDETKFVHDLPKSKNATTEQTQYIEGVFNKYKTMLTTMI
jgi:hypothetical protein